MIYIAYEYRKDFGIDSMINGVRCSVNGFSSSDWRSVLGRYPDDNIVFVSEDMENWGRLLEGVNCVFSNRCDRKKHPYD